MKLLLRSALVSLAGFTLGGLAVSSPAVAGDDVDELLQRADDIAREVAKLRGLKRKKPIERGVMSKDEIRERLVKRVDQEYTPEELDAEELALKRLGMLPANADYKQLVIDLFTEEIAGFYDPRDKKLYIARAQVGKTKLNELLMAHEIDHALQDQHFALHKFLKPNKRESDAAVARQALIEGDGTALMFEFMMQKMGMDKPWADTRTTDAMIAKMATSKKSAAAGRIPLVLSEGMLFPYMAGLGFVAHFRKHHPWKRIDAMYKKPPLSTEHILHPETYERYERPDTVTVNPIPSLSDHQLVYESVNGEFGLSLLLRQHAGVRMQTRGDVHAPREKAERATAGWGGDRIAVFTPPDHRGGLPGTVAVMYTLWDGEADAIEFFEMLSDAMGSLSAQGDQPGTEIAASEVRVEYRGPSGDGFVATRKGDAVVAVLGADKDRAQTVLDEVWSKWRVRRR